MKRYHVTTFGCQMNAHDSERIKGMLESLGIGEAATQEEADVLVFNTCTIREKPDTKFAAHLAQATALKRRDPDKVIAVGGCYAEAQRERLFQLYPEVDVAFGPGSIPHLGDWLGAGGHAPMHQVERGSFGTHDHFAGDLPMRRERAFQAWVQISVGCNCRCSYCIVPSTRGREASRPSRELLEEVRGVADEGVSEVTLLGQNVNSYGRDLPQGEKTSFAELLAMVDSVEGIERVRYTSPHPKDMKEDVLRAHAELPSLCEHIHLPLQAGSSRILKAMRRTYDKERYLDRVAMIREHVPDVALTTDIIVGFPGETEEEFEETLEVVEHVRYDSAFTFIFSPRRGTEAAGLPGQLSHPVKRARMERLVESVQRLAQERSQRFVGRDMEVLVEGASRTDPDRLRGRIRHNKTVNFAGTAQPGELAQVEIESATSTTLAGSESLPARVG